MGAAELVLLWFYWAGGEAVILTPAARNILGADPDNRILGSD
jgi:hypothetical protein